MFDLRVTLTETSKDALSSFQRLSSRIVGVGGCTFVFGSWGQHLGHCGMGRKSQQKQFAQDI